MRRDVGPASVESPWAHFSGAMLRSQQTSLQIFNTLTRSPEAFVAMEPGRARIYTCSPTVYRYAHIGNLRSYLLADWLRRYLEAHGYSVTQVKNITDVGHMRQDLLERGEDKQQAAGLEEGARVATDPLKRDQRDFALWKAAERGRTLKWPSPWGEGFPGWHIECSAMAERFLGRELDFHTGGVDNIFPHHEDEIAQSEAVLGRQHVRYWLHGQHLLVDGLKMAKSTGNTYLISDLEQRGFDAMAFRYLCATAHFRARLNFTLPSLRAAQRGLARLRRKMREEDGRVTKKAKVEAEELRNGFWAAAANGLNMPAAFAVAWRVARSRLAGE